MMENLLLLRHSQRLLSLSQFLPSALLIKQRMLSLGGNGVILPRCIYEHFLHCHGITSGNFKLHEKQDNKSMLIKRKKKKRIRRKTETELVGSLLESITKGENYKRLFGDTEKHRRMPLRRAGAVLASVAVSALFLTSSDCAGGELPGANPGKAAKETA